MKVGGGERMLEGKEEAWTMVLYSSPRNTPHTSPAPVQLPIHTRHSIAWPSSID